MKLIYNINILLQLSDSRFETNWFIYSLHVFIQMSMLFCQQIFYPKRFKIDAQCTLMQSIDYNKCRISNHKYPRKQVNVATQMIARKLEV